MLGRAGKLWLSSNTCLMVRGDKLWWQTMCLIARNVLDGESVSRAGGKYVLDGELQYVG